MNYHIRPATPADVPTLMALRTEAENWLRQIGSDQWSDPETASQAIAKWHQHVEDGRTWVILDEADSVIGTVSRGPADRPGDAGKGFAAGDFWRRGLRGSALAFVPGDDMNETTEYQWYVASLGRTLVWARLRVREAGTAEVFDSDGNTLTYDSDDTARAALFDAEFVAFDGLDEDDALARGFSLDEVSPPRAENDAALRHLMVQSLGARA